MIEHPGKWTYLTILVIAFLSIAHLFVFGEDHLERKKTSKHPRFRLWTFPVLIDGPFGVVSTAELIGIVVFVVFIFMAVYVYTIRNLNLLAKFQFPTKEPSFTFYFLKGVLKGRLDRLRGQAKKEDKKGKLQKIKNAVEEEEDLEEQEEEQEDKKKKNKKLVEVKGKGKRKGKGKLKSVEKKSLEDKSGEQKKNKKSKYYTYNLSRFPLALQGAEQDDEMKKDVGVDNAANEEDVGGHKAAVQEDKSIDEEDVSVDAAANEEDIGGKPTGDKAAVQEDAGDDAGDKAAGNRGAGDRGAAEENIVEKVAVEEDAVDAVEKAAVDKAAI
ncbi:hypothetical protein Q3G72_029841 [Acer saccharum]|nr:hypothetical protein Q3G72_029841 [Acer saccharum]